MEEILNKIETFTVNHLPIVKTYADKIKLVEVINELIPSNKNVDHGTIILAMVLDTLTGRSPLYRLEEFYSKQDTELLLGKQILPSAFTDDSIARTLDDIFEYGSMKIFSKCCLQACKAFDVDYSHAHFDTTSRSVFGDYLIETTEGNAPNVTYGHSKDKRFDLKQFIMGILCVDRAVPVFGMIEDGNASDKTSNNKLLTKISGIMSQNGIQEDGYIYVADSAVVTENNLKELENIFFITRLPANYDECGRVVTEAVEKNKWNNIGILGETKPTKNRPVAEYKSYETQVDLYGMQYRAMVIHSSSHDKRRHKRIERELSKSRKDLDKQIKEESKKQYYCEKDAQEAASQLASNSNEYYKVETSIVKKIKYGPGRPSSKRKPKEIKYSVQFVIHEKKDNVGKKRAEAGCFVMLSNIPAKGDNSHTSGEILKIYKEQHGVERNFTFLKDPVIVNSIFLKKQDRMEVLGLVLLLSLLIWRLMERSMRHYVEKNQTTLMGFDKKLTDRPTSFMMTTKFSGIIILKVDKERRVANGFNEVQKEYLLALGVSFKNFIDPNSG